MYIEKEGFPGLENRSEATLKDPSGRAKKRKVLFTQLFRRSVTPIGRRSRSKGDPGEHLAFVGFVLSGNQFSFRLPERDDLLRPIDKL